MHQISVDGALSCCRVLDAETNTIVLDTRGAGDSEAQAFETGMGMVPEALDLCVRLMTVQEVATVTSTSTYAYDGRSDRPQVLLQMSCHIFMLIVSGSYSDCC